VRFSGFKPEYPATQGMSRAGETGLPEPSAKTAIRLISPSDTPEGRNSGLAGCFLCTELAIVCGFENHNALK
jgi:hypothetical protein